MVGAFCPYVAGPVLVKVNLRDGYGFVDLGYTEDGVQAEENFFTNPIHADIFGGTAGPEVDRQFMGKTARLSLRLSIYSLAVVKKMREGQSSTNWSAGNPGTLVNIGGLITCTNAAMQILLVGAGDTAAVNVNGNAVTMAANLNFPNCWYDGPVRFPLGAKNTVFDFDLKATPFTTNPTASGDGVTRLWMENNHLVTNMASYNGSGQAA